MSWSGVVATVTLDLPDPQTLLDDQMALLMPNMMTFVTMAAAGIFFVAFMRAWKG